MKKTDEKMIEPEHLPPSSAERMERLLAKIAQASNEQLLQFELILKDITPDSVFDIPGACKILNCSRATLFRLMKAGEIRPMLLDQKQRLFSSCEVYRFFRKRYPGRTWPEEL